jgi:hypothetical protein
MNRTPGPDGAFWIGITNALAITMVVGGLVILIGHLL